MQMIQRVTSVHDERDCERAGDLGSNATLGAGQLEMNFLPFVECLTIFRAEDGLLFEIVYFWDIPASVEEE